MAKIDKGARIIGAQRSNLTKQVTASYVAGASIRALAVQYGRSYGFIHTLVTESGTPIRSRGGSTYTRTK